MRSHTLEYRMHRELDRGYKYISLWALVHKSYPEFLRTTFFKLHPACRKYKNLMPVLENLNHVTPKEVPKPTVI